MLQVLQSLGKTGKTTDEQIAEDSQRLEKQQVTSTAMPLEYRDHTCFFMH